MDTKRIKGVEPLAIDKKVLAAQKKNTDPWGFPGPGRYNIAIRNAEGVIYRTTSMDDWGEYVGLSEDLAKLGLKNELTPDQVVGGMDAIFSLAPTA